MSSYLDLRNKRCPETFLYAKLAMDRLDKGQFLEIRLHPSTSIEELKESMKEEGYTLSLITEQSEQVTIQLKNS